MNIIVRKNKGEDTMGNSKIIGMKYQTYIDDELVVFRLVGIKNWDSFIMKNDKDPKKVRIIMTKDQLQSCVALQPDALMHVMNTSSNENGTEPDDVYVCVTTTDSMKEEAEKGTEVPPPTLILRQDLYSQVKNSFYLNEENKIMLGECQSAKTLSREELLDMMQFKKVTEKCSIALYLDDTLKDVMECIGKRAKMFDKALENIQAKYKENKNIGGLSSTLKSLLKDNMFMEHFRLLFNITTLDIPIELDDDGEPSKEIVLNGKQKKYLEDLLKQYITDIKVLRYDKDIDISKIVQTTHIVVCDWNEKIYLISYVVSGAYPVDEEAKAAMLNLIK